MICTVRHPQFGLVDIDYAQAQCISTGLHRNINDNPNAYYLDTPRITAVQSGDFIGDVTLGGPVNCDILTLSPHGNGTHTECVGHISTERFSIDTCWKIPFAWAIVCTVGTTAHSTDESQLVLDSETILRVLDSYPVLVEPRALLLRIADMSQQVKQTKQWSGTYPPCLSPALAAELSRRNIQHLMVEIPSIDPEIDGGALLAHRAFWQYPSAPRLDATITEMIVVPETISDGEYFLTIQLLDIQSDASPAKIHLIPFTLSVLQTNQQNA